MSMTKYMHPRNIYKTPPNFTQLAIDYPEFRKHVKQELNGKVSIDFKNIEALRALTCTLLKKDFQLDVQIPLTKLIPTIPLRLNYILWIEDLMEISKSSKCAEDEDAIIGIDIGTGASCVYPLIAAQKNKWNMLATDIDDDSINCARENVTRNGLDDRIKVIKTVEDCLLNFPELQNGKTYNFCMCNPPFFSSRNETNFLFKSRKESRPRPKNAFAASHQEVIAKGGEIQFISKIIHESQQLQDKIKVYTSMIGQLCNLAPIKKLLREVDVASFKQTEFCQGNTTRWGLAWTFCDIDLRKVPETTLQAQRKLKVQQKQLFIHQIKISDNTVTLEDVHLKLLEIFSDLQFLYNVKHTKSTITYEIESQSNTWSHQRRKRRAAQREANNTNESTSSNNATQEITVVNEKLENPSISHVDATVEMISQMQVKSPKKRDLEDDGYYNNKRFKTNASDPGFITETVFLSAKLLLFINDGSINIELMWHRGVEKRDALHQILQYLKNNLKI